MYLFVHLLILERGRERNINVLFHLFMHSLVDSSMCPDGIEPASLAHWDAFNSNQLRYLARALGIYRRMFRSLRDEEGRVEAKA